MLAHTYSQGIPVKRHQFENTFGQVVFPEFIFANLMQ